MKKMRKLIGSVFAVTMIMTCSLNVYAMPADIEEAVTEEGYNAYAHESGTAEYDESELLDVKGTYIATADAMIRKSPFGEILGSVVPGQAYEVVGECPDCMWYKISGNVPGYVYASYMVPQSDYNAGASYNVRELDMLMVVDAYALNVRTAPSLSGSVIKSLPQGTEVHVTGKVLNADWYECELDGQTVYMSDDYLTPELPQTMVCTADALNIRASAGMDGQIIGTLYKGDKVKITADENDWLKFSFSDGRIGYVYDEYMAAIN